MHLTKRLIDSLKAKQNTLEPVSENRGPLLGLTKQHLI